MDLVNEEIKFTSYTSAKDIIQFVLLHKSGVIIFDLDITLKDKVIELSGKGDLYNTGKAKKSSASGDLV